MGLTPWASRKFVADADSLQQDDKCAWWAAQWGASHHYGRSCGVCTETHYGESSLHNYGIQLSFPVDFSLIVAQNFHGAPVVQKIVRQVSAKQLTPEHKAKRMESALTFLQRCHDDGAEGLERIITGDETWIAHIPETKHQSKHWRQSGSPFKKKFKQTSSPGKWCARHSGIDGIFSSWNSWPEGRQWMLSVTAKHCRNCDRPSRTSGPRSFVPVLSCCTIR